MISMRYPITAADMTGKLETRPDARYHRLREWCRVNPIFTLLLGLAAMISCASAVECRARRPFRNPA
jgi:hypothetical protein